MKNLTLIIPTKKEVESLPVFLKELKSYKCQKLIVMQKEDHATFKKIKKIKNIKIIKQKKNGYGNALIEGIKATRTKYCCIINADGSMNPKYLKKMYKYCEKKDLVFASRYQKPGGGSHDDDIITFIGNHFFTIFGNIFFKLSITDILFTYILGKTKSFKKLKLLRHDFRICVELPIKAKRIKLNYSCIPSFERARIGGKKKVSPLKDGFLILTEMIRLLFR